MAEPTLRVTVSGATGVTGAHVVRGIEEDAGLALAGALAAPEDPAIGRELAPGIQVTADPAEAIRGADVVVDFSAPAAVAGLLDAVAGQPIPMAIGTTALPQPVLEHIHSLGGRVPLVLAPNMSLGVNVLRQLVREAVRAVGPVWDAEIVEVHHRRKVDAPSGTALALAQDLATASDRATEVGLELGRCGAAGPRARGAIGVHAVRGGDVVGEHTVLLLGDGERLELVHRASDRRTFAAGALRAARWLTSPDREPGVWGMADVLRT